MMVRNACLLVAFIAFVANSRGSVPTTDSQLWSEIDAVGKISTETTATIIATGRFGDALPNPTLYGGGLQFDVSAGAWTASGGALFVGIRSGSSGGQTQLQLPLCAVSYARKIGGVTISDRNRIERLEGIPGSPSRYRNRLGIDFPLRNAGPISHAFITDEGFYAISTSTWNRNRAQAGIGLPLGGSMELQVFFLRQDSRTGAPRSLNVVGTTLKVFL
jgi:Protein of unknown function (DUF2490)